MTVAANEESSPDSFSASEIQRQPEPSAVVAVVVDIRNCALQSSVFLVPIILRQRIRPWQDERLPEIGDELF